jgi:hypothetical protein
VEELVQNGTAVAIDEETATQKDLSFTALQAAIQKQKQSL